MQCPTDATTLVMSERSGIEIDYCPQCRGVWLDRGELDKIIERVRHPSRAPGPTRPRSPSRPPPQVRSLRRPLHQPGQVPEEAQGVLAQRDLRLRYRRQRHTNRGRRRPRFV